MFVILVFQLAQEPSCMDKSMPELPKDCNNKNHFFSLFLGGGGRYHANKAIYLKFFIV